MKKFEFTYVVKNVDMYTGDILVEYSPTDVKLTNYTLNISTCIPDDDGEIKSITQSIIDFAPHNLWASQELLLLALPNLINSTATVTPE
jgi:hypothetical protein